MDLRRFVAFCLLFLLGYLLYQARPVMVSGAIEFREGRETEADRQKLAEDVAKACGLEIPSWINADPFLLSGDFLPGGETELALAAQVSATGGILALLAPQGARWRLVCHLGPDRLGVPSSLSNLVLPGRPGMALVLTDLADQMAGAFSRRETCAIYTADGSWQRLWSRDLDSSSYWNRAWNHPPGTGWLLLAGQADWQPVAGPNGIRLSVSYRNILAEAPPGARLPEEHHFTVRRETTGREDYAWNPATGLFALGYARTRAAVRLMSLLGNTLQPTGTVLRAGQAVAILADGAGDPRTLLGQPRMLEVLIPGQRGLLSPSAVDRLPGRPADFPGQGRAWLAR